MAPLVESITPNARGACFTESSFNEAMAQNLLRNKVGAVSSSHNKLHLVLGEVGKAATMMQVAPRLQDHPLTSESVAIALHSLAHARGAVILGKGLALLSSYRNHHLGGAKANDFLLSYGGDDDRDVLRTLSRRELELLASETSLSTKSERMTADHDGAPNEVGTAMSVKRPASQVAKPEPAACAPTSAPGMASAVPGGASSSGDSNRCNKRRRVV